MKRVALALLVVAGAPGCEKPDKQLVGVGKWNVDTTTLEKADGKCLPDDLPDGRQGMYCFGQRPLAIKGITVELDLYFAGVEPTSKLVEIQMKAIACDADVIETWTRSNFGRPFETRGARKAWKNRHLYVVGDIPLPDDPMRCILRVIPLREQGYFEKFWPPAAAPATPPQ